MEALLSSIAPNISIFNLNNRLFQNVLEGLAEEQAQQRPAKDTNHALFLAGHLVSSRYSMAQLIGLKVENPYQEQFSYGKKINDGPYPKLEEIKKEWEKITSKLVKRLNELGDEELNANSPIPVPIDDKSLRGLITFFAHHETYHIGQIGLLRKYAGLPGMKY